MLLLLKDIRLTSQDEKGTEMAELQYEIVSSKVYNKNIWEFCNSNRFLVSVVVVTHQREYNVGECLYSIINQKTDFDFEIVIVDDASTDSTEKTVERECAEFIQNKRLKYIKICTRLGYTKPSYIGAAASDGKIIIFQPSDMIAIKSDGTLQGQCFQKLVDALDDKTVAAFAKECRIFPRAWNPEGWRNNPAVLKGIGESAFGGAAHAKGKGEAWFALGAIRWTDYRRLTDFRAPFPDSRLSALLNKDGRDLKFLDDVICVHLPHMSSNLEGMSQHWWTSLAEPF